MTRQKNLISIIVPTYNGPKVLSELWYSLSKQKCRDFEVIIVDDGSKVPYVKPKGVDCKVIRQENQGASAARNRGFQDAQGEYVLFLDNDVIMRPGMLKQMRATLESHPEVSYVYCNYYLGKSKKMPAQEFDPQVLHQRNYISTMSMIRARDFSGFDASLNRFQDWDLWLSLYKQGKVGKWIDSYLFSTYPKRGGISTWLPKFAYKEPFKHLPYIKKRVQEYERAQAIVRQKHGIT